jgi:hypothetical protein
MGATLRATITPATTAAASFLQSKECLMRNAQRDIGANNKKYYGHNKYIQAQGKGSIIQL